MKNRQSITSKSGAQDKIEGTGKNLAGKIKEGVGKALGNPRLEAEGRSDQVRGNAQKKIGQIKQVFDR